MLTLDLSVKRGTQQLDQVFSLKYRDFDQLHKTLSGPPGLRGKNSFCCGSIHPRIVLIHKKKNFKIWKFFHVKTGKNQQKFAKTWSSKKYIFPHFPTIFDEIPNKYH